MSDATNPVLEQAYALIEADRLDEAENLLRPVLAQDPDNVDAWWLYVHAVKDVETARMALNTVLKLDPSYPGAQDLLTTLESRFPVAPVASTEATNLGIKRLAPPTSLPDLPEDDDIDAPFDLDSGVLPPDDDVVVEDKFAQAERKLQAAQAAAAQRRRMNPMWLAIGALIAVVLIGLLLALRSRQGAQPTPTATLVSQGIIPTVTLDADTTPEIGIDLTEDATLTSEAQETDASVVSTEEQTEQGTEDTFFTPTAEEVLATQDAATEEATDSGGGAPVASTPAADTEISAVESALADFETVPDSTGKQTTLLGITLLTDVCSAPDSASLSDTLSRSMTSLASASGELGDDTQAIGVRLVDCSTNEVLRVIAAPLESAISFSSASIDERDFQGQWVAVP
jgi:hypothetical protein